MPMGWQLVEIQVKLLCLSSQVARTPSCTQSIQQHLQNMLDLLRHGRNHAMSEIAVAALLAENCLSTGSDELPVSLGPTNASVTICNHWEHKSQMQNACTKRAAGLHMLGRHGSGKVASGHSSACLPLVTISSASDACSFLSG